MSEIMKRFKAEVFLPLIYMNRLIGFINLGHKAKEEMYYHEDLNLLNCPGQPSRHRDGKRESV